MNARSFETPHNATWLPLLRIGTALLLIIDFAQIWPDLTLFYSARGLISTPLLEALDPVSGPTILQAPLASSGPFQYSYLAFCVLLGMGLFTRFAAAALLFLHYYWFISVPVFSYGADYIASGALFYCLFFPCGHYHSFDRRIFHLKPSTLVNPSLRILQIHVCIIYFFAGLGKLLGPTWHNGEALWKSMNLPGFSGSLAALPPFLHAYPWLWVVAGWGVFLLELSYPLFIWLTPTRKYWLWAIIGLHVGIALFMGLYFFSAIMILLNLCAFYYPYLTPSANQEQINIPMVSPLSPPAATDETRGEAGGPIQTPPDDMI